jgi:hypothetical protein
MTKLPPRPHRDSRAGFFSFAAAAATGGASLSSAFDPTEIGGATKPNSSTHAIALKQRCLIARSHLVPLAGLDLNLIDFEPWLALAGAFLGTP